MKKPVITLKSVKLFTSGSEETPCYNAKLYVDGKFLTHVDNDGRGGPDRMDWTNSEEIERVEKLVAATFPKSSYTNNGETHYFDASLEGICHELAWRSVDVRNFASKLSRTVMIVKGKDVYALKGKASAVLIELANKRYGKDAVLNNMTSSAAFDRVEELSAA